MDEHELSALRQILEPLDLRPLFWVVSGDHATGLAAPGSPVAVRGLHREALGAALGEGRPLPSLRIELLDRGLRVLVRSEDRRRTAARLLGGEPGVFEALHSPLILAGGDELLALRAIAGGLVVRRLARHYRRLAAREAKALAEGGPFRRDTVLRLFRALLAELHLLLTGQVQPDFARLVEARGVSFLEPFVARPAPLSHLGDPARIHFLLSLAEDLRGAIATAEAANPLPETPTGDAVRRLLAWRDADRPAIGNPLADADGFA